MLIKMQLHISLICYLVLTIFSLANLVNGSKNIDAASFRGPANVTDNGGEEKDLIVNGMTVPDYQYKFMASLYVWNGSVWAFNCGGTLITPNHILTAAHCVYDDDSRLFSPILVVLNSKTIYSPSQNSNSYGLNPIVKVVYSNGITPHESYFIGSSYAYNDLAILKFNSAVDSIKAINRNVWGYRYRYVDTNPTVAIGWGDVYTGGPSSVNLLSVGLNLNSASDCQGRFPYYDDVTQLCTISDPNNPKSICMGDSGGPLITTAFNDQGFPDLQIGINSYGSELGCQYGAVYTRVSAYNDWISSKIQ